ncbi:copper resistance protein CopC [Frigoribacterium sp. 2-23]|uniref:copper resistance CopC family protein n=1 Tax=Frigoribacterium sp. 2-23 TaxID=3415006 RepID=UPI003C6EF491
MRSTLATRLGVSVGALGLVGLAALGPASVASAHDYVIASTPGASSTVTSPPSTVSVTFNDVILDLSGTGTANVLEVTDAAGRHFEDGCGVLDGPTISTGVALGAAGSYTMTYQVVSADGHTVSDAIPFSYAPSAGAPEAVGSPSRPACDPGESSAAPSDTATTPEAGATSPAETSEPQMTTLATTAPESTDAGSTNLGLVVGIAVAIVVLAVAGVVVIVVSSRRRGDRAPESDDSGPDQPLDD